MRLFTDEHAEVGVLQCPWEHVARVEVRYAETDAMGVVHHSVYLIWFELARIEFLRTHGMPFTQIESDGWQSPVVSLAVDYLKSSRFGDVVEVSARLSRAGIRFRFDYQVMCNGELLVRGHTLHVFTKEGKPTRLPKHFIQHFFAQQNTVAVHGNAFVVEGP